MSNPKNNKKLVKFFCTKVFVNYDLSALNQLIRDDYFQHNPDARRDLMLLICSVFRTANCRALGRGRYLQPIQPVGQNQINFHKLFLWYCTYVHVT